MEILNVTLNPSDMGASNVLSNGNLTVINTATTGIRATHGKTSGKWYWEVKFVNGSVDCAIGISNKSKLIGTGINTDAGWRGYRAINGNKFPDNVAYGAVCALNDVIGVTLDLDNGTIAFIKNGVNMGTSHTNIKDLGEVFPIFVSGTSTSKAVTFNFGASAFAYAIPNGYQAYNLTFSNKFLISTEDRKNINSIKENGYTNNIVPVMTSNTSPQGTVDASTFTATREPWRAFDGELTQLANAWMATVNIKTGYLSYRFIDKKVISQYSVTGLYQNPTFSPKDWTFEGSNDGVNWTVLDSQSNVTTWTSSSSVPSTNAYAFNNNSPFYYYRINVTANGGGSTLGIQELQMMEKLSSTYESLDSDSEKMFLDHGLNKSYTLDLNQKMSDKSYVNTTSQILGSGKVFKQKIDTTKTPIKKAAIT